MTVTELSQSLLPVYGTLSATTFVLYDHITTFDLEVNIVWKRKKWSIVQYLFMVNRYMADVYMIYLSVTVLLRHTSQGKEVRVMLPFLTPANKHFTSFIVIKCMWQGIVPGMLGMVVLNSMQYIMALRVSSLYDHRRRIVILLVSALILETVLMVVIYAVKNSIEGVKYMRYVCTTFYKGTFRLAFLNMFPFIGFELLIIVLVGLEAYRYNQGTPRGHFGSANARLIRTIFRDSLLFPIITIIVCIFCSLSYSSLNEKPLGEFFSHQAIGVVCLLGPRLILNLRDAYYEPFIMEMEQDGSSRGESSGTSSSRRSTLRRDHNSSDDPNRTATTLFGP